jgi:hypothetical protein
MLIRDELHVFSALPPRKEPAVSLAGGYVGPTVSLGAGYPSIHLVALQSVYEFNL